MQLPFLYINLVVGLIILVPACVGRSPHAQLVSIGELSMLDNFDRWYHLASWLYSQLTVGSQLYPFGFKAPGCDTIFTFFMVSINWKSPCSPHRYPGGQPSFRVPGGRFLRRSRDQHLMDWTGFVLLLGGAYGLRGCCVRGAPVETVYQVAGYHGCKNGDAIL